MSHPATAPTHPGAVASFFVSVFVVPSRPVPRSPGGSASLQPFQLSQRTPQRPVDLEEAGSEMVLGILVVFGGDGGNPRRQLLERRLDRGEFGMVGGHGHFLAAKRLSEAETTPVASPG